MTDYTCDICHVPVPKHARRYAMVARPSMPWVLCCTIEGCESCLKGAPTAHQLIEWEDLLANGDEIPGYPGIKELEW